MKIFDCFMYFDEDLLLELRLNILNDYVDKFIIVESDLTHTEKIKKFKFDVKKFKKFEHKIEYHKLKNLKIDKNLKLKKNWSRFHLIDQSIRNSISNYISEASMDDWVIISDIDEIPNPNLLEKFNEKKKYAFFEQDLFYYKFNLKCISEPRWYGSRICVKKYLKSPQWLRNIKIKSKKNFLKSIFNNYQILTQGGWHFTYIKKPKEIITKLNSFAHNELVKSYMLNEDYIKNKIDNHLDLFERDIVLKKVEIENNNFPKYLINNKEKFKDFII